MYFAYSQMFKKADSFLSSKRVCSYALALAIITWFLILTFLIPDPHPGRDFRAFYTAAVVAKAHPHKVYNIAAQSEVQRNYGTGVHWHYLNPPPFTALLIPLAYLPYRTAYWLWTVVTAVLYFAAIRLVIRGAPSLRAQLMQIFVVAAAAPAFQWLMITGQTTSLALFIWALVYCLLRQQRFAAAGAVLGALVFRIQYFAMVIPLVVWKRFTTVLQGFVASSILILLFGAWTMSFSLYGEYVDVLSGFWVRISEQLQPLSRHITIYGFVRNFVPAQWALALTAVGAVPLLHWFTQVWRGKVLFDCPRFDLQFAALILTTLLLMHHGLVYDLLLVTIPTLLIYKNREFFPRYYKLLLLFIFFVPYYFISVENLSINPVQPLLYWLSFEIYRAHGRMLSAQETSLVCLKKQRGD